MLQEQFKRSIGAVQEHDKETQPSAVLPRLFPLSARSPDALRALAQSYQDFFSRSIDDSSITLDDICYTASIRRTHHENRLALVARSQADITKGLKAFLDGAVSSAITSGQNASGKQHKLVFVFPGQGSQWPGMGRELLAQEPVFRAAMEQCEQALRPYIDWSPLELLADCEAHAQLNAIDYVQPALFAFQVALAALWRSWGIVPDAVVGHSIGEVAAAHVAGILSLEDAARIICGPGVLLKSISGQGAMAVVNLSMNEAQQAIAGYEDRLAVAVSNSPTVTTLSGDVAALEEVITQLRSRNVFCRPVNIDVAGHSPQMDPFLEGFLQKLQGIQPQPAKIPFYSTVTGTIGCGPEFDAVYWTRNMREPVRLSQAIQHLLGDQYDVFLEVSPHPLLVSSIRQCLQYFKQNGLVLASLRYNRNERETLLKTLGVLYTSGWSIAWKQLYPSGQCVQLPTSSWPRKHSLSRQEETELPPESYRSSGESNLRKKILEAAPEARIGMVEAYLSGQIAKMLDFTQEVDAQEPLSQLGIDSLMAVEIRNVIETDLGIALSLVSFLKGYNLNQLAQEILDQLTNDPATLPEPEMDSMELASLPSLHMGRDQFSDSVYPLSYGQRALWFLHQLAPESGAYNESVTWRIHARLDIAALQSALQILVERHPVLRTVYILQEGKPVQKVLEPGPVAFVVTDATAWSWEDIKTYLAEEMYRPVNLEQGPVFRVRLFMRKHDEYILMLIMHHIATDAWSYMVLLDELYQAYIALRAGQSVVLPELKMQYRDYVRWQMNMLSGAKGQKLWTYWQRQLEGPLPVLQLPTDHPRPATQTFVGSTYSFTLGEQVSQQIKVLAQAKGVTVYTLLLAAFQVLLYRYTGQQDILVGSPVNGRARAAFDGIIGYFVNLVVLRARLNDNFSFASFLAMAHQTVIEALDNQDYPFPLLVDRLQIPREPGRSPLCDVAFVMEQLNRHALSLVPSEQGGAGVFAEGFTGAHLNLGELDLEFVSVEQRKVKFDLELQIVLAGDTFSGTLHYNSTLFESDTIARLAHHFQVLLLHILADPDQSIATIPLLPQNEFQHIVKAWNATSVTYPLDLCLHQLIEQQVERAPTMRAVVYKEQALSYHELNQRANQVAHYLREAGIGPEARVGICMERSLEFVVGLLGIWKAGGAYVPLDPAWPRERLRSVLEDASVQLLLTQQSQLAALSPQHSRVVALDGDWPAIMQQPVHNPTSEVTPNNLAYIIYTSGSTGKPKGVMIQHRSVTNYTCALRDLLACTPGWQYALVSTPTADLGNTAIFCALVSGGCLHVLPREMIIDGEVFARYMAQHSIDVIKIVPSHLRSLLATGGKQTIPCRALVVGGEAFPRSLLEQIRAMDARCAIINHYGPTEATIGALVAVVSDDTPDGSSVVSLESLSASAIDTVPLGRPIANTQAYILDKYLQPVPIGVTGELYIGGAGLAREYCNLPDLTNERFLPNPFSEEAGSRLYKTGDLARYRPDGVVEFLGRADQQIKLRGFRIEPGEIEACLVAHPALRESVVLLHGNDPEDQRLVAYLVAEGQPPPISDVRRWLLERLPDYMVPTTFVYLEKLPLNPNGKIDRHALPVPDYARPQLETAYILPQTDVEQTIAQIWLDVLHLDEVGVQDNFFELGGNSLLMSEVHYRLRMALQREVALTTLFRYPNIKSLANFIEQEQRPSAVEEGAMRASNRLAHLRQRQQQRLRERATRK